MKTEIPAIEAKQHPGAKHHCLYIPSSDWSALNEWAYCNIPDWHRVVRRADENNMSELDKTRLLAWCFMNLAEEMKQRELERARANPFPPIIFKP
jgi:hypothetical protein